MIKLTMKVQLGDTEVPSGATVSRELSRAPLHISYLNQPNIYYTVIMYDPDAPIGTFLHYLVANVPGIKLEKGEIIFSYIPPNPPAGTGTHRYIIAVFSSPWPIRIESELKTKVRAPFDVASFVHDHHLAKQQESYFRVKS